MLSGKAGVLSRESHKTCLRRVLSIFNEGIRNGKWNLLPTDSKNNEKKRRRRSIQLARSFNSIVQTSALSKAVR